MQKLTLEKQINLLERDIQQKQNKIEDLTKVVDQQTNFVESAKAQIKNLQDTQQKLYSQLFDIKQERDNFKCVNQIKEQQIMSLKEQVLAKIHVEDTQQLKHELQDQYNQILELQVDLKAARNQLEHSELERQNLLNELKIKAVSQVVQIQNEFNIAPLQNFNQYLDKFEEERKQYLRQIHQYQIREDKIKNENKKRIDRLQAIIDKSEENSKNQKEELLILQKQMEMYKKQSQADITNQRIYEEQKLKNELEMRAIIEKKDKLISDQKKEIQKLHQRIGQSPQMILSTINDMFNMSVDESVDMKIENIELKNTIKSLQDQIVQEQKEKQNIQEYTKKECATAIQLKQEYLQQKAFAESQNQKLVSEIQENKQLKDDIFKLEASLAQLKRKDQIYRTEIERLRQDNLNNQKQIFISQKEDNKSSVNQSTPQITINQDLIKNNIQQFEQLTTEIRNLKQTLNKKEEEIINLKYKIDNPDSNTELEEQQKNSTITIAKKIEKIQTYSKKQSKMLADFRKLKLERNKYEFTIDEHQYEIKKLQSQIQLEQIQKEQLMQTIQKYKEEFRILEEQNMKEKQDFGKKIKQIQQETEQKFVSQEQIDYQKMNQELLKLKEQDKKLVQELKEKVKTLSQDAQKYREEILQKDLEIKRLQLVETKSEEHQNTLQMKLQIENDKIIIKSLNERIFNLNQEIENKEKELLAFQQDKLDWESLQQFSRQIANENRSNLNNQEDINDLKKNLKGLQKKISEQTQQYQQAIADFGKEFQQIIMQQNDEIKQLEQENQDLAKALEQYKQLYQQERMDRQNKSDLTLAEIEEIKIRLDQVTKERDQLLLKKEIIENKEYQILRKEDEIRSQEMELQEEKKNFESYIQKRKLEITDDILIKKNKELSIIGCDYILGRELEIYKQKLIEEQEKVNELMQRSIQQMEDYQEGNQDLYEKKQMENQLNDLKKQIEEMRAEQLKLRMDSKVQDEEQYNFEEERQQYQQQIRQLMHLKENVTLEDIKLVRDIIQSGKLISYLEKAKQIHELQTSMQS
ncbi:unnamed protein product [Paramecium octaurelia]|uniref:Uncharacterized protein n=1 Tax=Paramecium octaurelia TaxID=43137 RepID=A0A8S1X178_PAROT|nr:unnamed protein product [Paramecium octaurelia]